MDVILPSALYALQVGSLVTGTVRRIEPFGVFVGINNTRISGLLHISNVSRRHIDTVDGMFEIGEEVKCLIMGMEPGYTNISLSIAGEHAQLVAGTTPAIHYHPCLTCPTSLLLQNWNSKRAMCLQIASVFGSTHMNKLRPLKLN
jgi:hypothetical protein